MERIRADKLHPEDLSVELVYGDEKDDLVIPRFAMPMEYVKQEQDGSYRYEIHLKPGESGSIAYGVRVLPKHDALAGKHEMGLVRWA
jgi:starch phosphorylase